MKVAELENAIDFKKLTIVDLQITLQEKYGGKRLKFLTTSGFIEADIHTHEPENFDEFPTLGAALGKMETDLNVVVPEKEVLNVHACVYLKDVKITPLASPDTPTYLDEFVLFTDHIMGLTLADT